LPLFATMKRQCKRNTQFYFGGTPARVQSDIHQIHPTRWLRLDERAKHLGPPILKVAVSLESAL